MLVIHSFCFPVVLCFVKKLKQARVKRQTVLFNFLSFYLFAFLHCIIFLIFLQCIFLLICTFIPCIELATPLGGSDFLSLASNSWFLQACTISTGLLIFRGKKRKISRDCRGKFAEKSSDFAGFSREKSQISKDFRGQIYGGKLRQETITNKTPKVVSVGCVGLWKHNGVLSR